MQWMILAVTAGLGFAVYQLIQPLMNRTAPMERLNKYTVGEVGGENTKPKQQYRQGVGVLARSIERSGLFSRYRKNLRKTLLKANILMKPEEFMAFQALAFVLGVAVGMLAFGTNPLVVIVGVMGISVPSVVVRILIKKRLKTINSQLGETLTILSNAMKAGHSFFQAIDAISREMTGPITEEFIKLQKEINFGVNTETALENMVDRVGSEDLELMVTAILIQRQVGGNLAEILDNISSTIRQRIKMKGEIKSLTAQGRMSGLIIGGLPFVLAGMMAFVAPDQLKLLISEPLGFVLIGAAILTESIGLFLVKKIVSIET